MAAAKGQRGLPVTFGKVEARGFIVAGNGQAVSVGVAGVDLKSGRLGQGGIEPAAYDSVSRVVIFPAPDGEALSLADAVVAGQKLRKDGQEFFVEAWVEQVRGRYLPFSLLRVGHPGAAPVSGSPLLNAKGQVAAVVYEPAGPGKLYAIPVDVVRRGLVAARDGVMSRAWMGVVLDPRLQIPQVVRVVEGSPAAAAGLRKGDILTELDGRRLADYGDAVNALFLLHVGKEATVKVRRGGKIVSARVTPQQSKGS
ncbi:S1C family serine protease [Haloferula rosea]|uniref:PDZ domain-containing protein n=1 Tax=Haloferula rosea TaxID=490093 RepID=A0A934VEF6_9BACT|nr:PDZ domain-containing protein [Haloferula rosea]MBK1825991.1 PDZ domain-containing protein [Haloferula rosea]